MKYVILVVAFAGLAACETVEGLGRDVSAGAQAVQNTF